jgi:integrase
MSSGSITKYQGKSGTSWHIRICVGYDQRGYPIQQRYTVYGAKRDAEAKLREILAKVDKGAYIKQDKTTLAEYIPKWYETHRRGLSPTTDRRYRDYINSHILPSLGNIELQKLTTIQVQEFINCMLESGNRCTNIAQGLSAKSVRDCIILLKQALKQAIVWGMLTRNPADGVRMPTVNRRDPQILAEAQAEEVLNSLIGTYGYIPALISYHTGMRLGEVIALPWDAVNLEAATIEVLQSYTLEDEDGRPVIKQPKTKAGRRIVEVGSTLLKALANHREAQLERRLVTGAAWGNNLNLVCTQDDGAPISSRAMGHIFSRRARSLGYNVTFHGLRHTHVSMLIKAGVPINTISARVGHSTPSITHDIYAHLLPGMGRHAVELFEKMLLGQATIN